jgi:hypothetical protein
VIIELDQSPPSAEEGVFNAFVDRLKQDPALAAIFRTWVTWDGDPADGEPPSSDMAPWIRLTPEPGEGVDRIWENPDRGAISNAMRVQVEVAILDQSAAARMRVWAEVRRAGLAIGPSKPAFKDAFAHMGISDVELVKNGYGIDKVSGSDGAGALIVSEGEFRLTYSVDV